jgi:hypothetical protein
MSKRAIGIVLLLLGSLLIGLSAGQRFFWIFDKTVPQGAMTDLVRAGTHGTYLLSGALFGVVVFVWALLVAVSARFFGGAASPGAPPAK